MLYGGIEAGGTKFVCAIGDESGNIIKKKVIETAEPSQVLNQLIPFFKEQKIVSLGVGSFGPVGVNKANPNYGRITTSPKVEWRNFPILKSLENAFNVPVGFTTDVNAAALGEWSRGAAKGMDSCLYITVGTGVGAGAIINGDILQGITHPEMGHILVRRHPEDGYVGTCPYHSDCLEGLAAGPAIERRWGKPGYQLEEDEKVWQLEGYYISQALMHYILILSPKKIILGGGVMKQKRLLPIIKEQLKRFLNNYLPFPEFLDAMDDYIVLPGLGDNAGIVGALLLAERELVIST